MSEKKNVPAWILAMIHGAICILSLRYFSFIIYDTVRNSCSIGEMTDQETLAVTFHSELLKETLPYYIPMIILHLFIVVLSFLTCISILRGKMNGRKGIVSYSLLGISAGAEIAYIWLLENNFFSYKYPNLQLACFLDARFYSPYGLFGDDGINLRFLTETNGYLLVKYVFLVVLLILSLILVIMHVSSEKRPR